MTRSMKFVKEQMYYLMHKLEVLNKEVEDMSTTAIVVIIAIVVVAIIATIIVKKKNS